MSAALATLINGEPQELLSVQDRGLQYGDGLFETLSCVDGRPRWLERHLERLALGCERLGIAAPDERLLRSELHSLLKGMPRAIAKVICTRGVATARGYRPSGDESPTRIVSVYEWGAARIEQFRLGLSQVPLACNPRLAGIKHLNRLEQVLAQRDAAAGNWHEVAMCTGTGEVICGSMSNLFVVRRGDWLTSPLGQCGVAGIMRSLVLELASRRDITVRIAPISTRELDEATSLFVTNVRWGVQPVHSYQGRALKVDERGVRLQESIDATVA